jgi:hypothetical protein
MLSLNGMVSEIEIVRFITKTDDNLVVKCTMMTDSDHKVCTIRVLVDHIGVCICQLVMLMKENIEHSIYLHELIKRIY